MKYFFGLLLLIGGLAGGLLAGSYILWQREAMTQFVAVPATILSSDVKVHHGKSTTYSPEITYSYVVNGKTYQSSQVFTFDSSTSDSDWADEIVRRYPVAATPLNIPGFVEQATATPNAQAYVNPRDPNDAILVREYMFLPYVLSYIALFFALAGIGAMFTDAFTVGRVKMEAVALDDSGWQLLMPKQNLKRRLRNAIIWFVGTALIIVPLDVHWFVIAGQVSIGSIIGSAIPLALLGAFGVSVFRRWSVSRHMSDVRLRVKPAPMVRGARFSLAMEADAYAPLRVKSAVARVVCVEHYKEKRGNKTNIGSRTRGEKVVELCGAASVAAGQVVEGSGEAVVQAGEMPPSSDLAVKLYPYYTWEVRLAVALEDGVDYAAVFPLTAQ